MCIHERRSESSLFGPKLKTDWLFTDALAEGLILPEANQILLLTADGFPSYFSSELTTQMCPTERERPQTDQLPRKYLLSFFCSRLHSKSKDLQLKQEAQLHA